MVARRRRGRRASDGACVMRRIIAKARVIGIARDIGEVFDLQGEMCLTWSNNGDEIMVLRHSLLALLVCITVAGASGQGIIESAECAVSPTGHISRCGYVTLPQDYDAPGDSKVEIFYALIHSRNLEPQPDPLVYLVGGPGSSGSQLLQTSFRAYLRAFAGDRDIIVIDQRGTGLSNPPLYCREALFRLDEILQSHHADHAELILEILTDCHGRLSGNDVQFDTFHSENNARDIVNVLLSLGYEQWNLVGVSYGSRLALAMMRDYPQYLRSVILDSVYPPQADIYLDSYYNGERALGVLFAACAASDSCNRRYPNLEDVFYQLYDRLNLEPVIATFTPPRYKQLNIEISGYRFYDWVFSWLYEVDSIQLIPHLIFDLARGKLEDAARIGASYEASMTALSLGMHYTVQCQEEFGSAHDRDYAGMLETYPHLTGFLSYPVEGTATLSRLCDIFRNKARPPMANSPVQSSVPALLLSGNFDPITPPSYAELAEATLSDSFSYVLPHVGHGVLRSDRCAVLIATAFIDEPLEEPDSSCIDSTRAIEFQ